MITIVKKIITLIAIYLVLSLPILQAKEYFVDGQNPVANDNNIGTIDLPLKTIDGARKLARTYIQSHLPLNENIIIWIRGGTYSLQDTISFSALDSGSAQFPVIYQGYQNEKVVISGKKTLDPSSFQTVLASDSLWGQIHASAKGTIISTNLNNVGITEYGTMANDNSTYIQLFINDQRQDMARWPDVGEQRSPAVLNASSGFDLIGTTNLGVEGRYVANGTSDGITAFKRQNLLSGVQYYLYRHYWNYQGQNYRAWFLTTQTSGYPASNVPFWYVYADNPNTLYPGTLATGNLKTGPNLIGEDAITNGFIGFQKADTDSSFYFLSDRVLNWGSANELMVHGFMNWLWSDSLTKVASINMSNRKVTLSQIPTYGVDDSHGGRLFVFNLIEEITKPGEWFLDKATGKLYLWPTSNFSSSKIAVSTFNKVMIQTTNTKYVTFKNISFDGGRNNTVDLSGGEGLHFDSCTFLNTGLDVIGFSQCLKSSVQNSTIMGAGKNGIWTYNWNLRTNLIESELLFQNNEISKVGQWRYAYMCPINMYYSVGVSILNNEMYDMPHTAILFSGNENKIYRNKIYDVCKKTSDAGAIYCGRDWAYRGNIIKNNFIYNLTSEVGSDVHAIYFDDAVAGNSAIGNILYNIKGYGVLHAGGRDTIVKGNVFYKCQSAYYLDNRGRTFINNTPNDTWNFFDRMTNTQVDYKAEPWKSKYPLLYAIPKDWAIVSNPANKWLEAGGSIVTANLGYQNTRFLTEYNYVTSGVSVTPDLKEYSNNVENTDPFFKDKDNLDFELLPNSPAFAITGFEDIPFRKIGLFKNTSSVITASAGAGGTISPMGKVIVKYGLNQTFTMTPFDGYEVESVLVDGNNLGAITTYTFSSVVIEHTISVTFKLKSYTITASASANGSITPIGVTTLTHGSSQVYTITPATGYVVASVLVNGVAVGALSEYTFSNISKSHTIDATFAKKTYTITASAGSNGTVSPTGAQTVAENSNLTFAITPDNGYQIESVKVDGALVTNASTYEFSNVLADHQIAITFSLIPNVTITASASSGGTISPVGSVKVVKGGAQNFTITANAGFAIDDVLVDGISQGKISSFSFNNLTADHTIAVLFKALDTTFEITSSVEGSGTISPLGKTIVAKNATQAYAIQAAAGFEVKDIIIDGVSVGKLSEYSFVNVTNNHTIQAIFVASIKNFTITASALENGLITPNGSSSVSEGEDISFLFVPDSKYQVLDVVVDGVSQGPLLSYEFENVSTNHSIQASFALVTKDSKKELLTFSFKNLESKIQGIINDDKVSIVVPTGTDLSSLVATFTFTGVKVLVNGEDLISGVSKIDFRQQVKVFVEAKDGSQKKYQVSVFDASEVTSGLISFDKRSYSVSESSGKAKITLNRFGGYSGIVKVKYETFQSTALETSDYVKNSGELICQDGDTANKDIEIVLVSDDVAEDDEVFSVKIISMEGGTEGSFQNTEIIIRNSDTKEASGSAGCSYSPNMSAQDQMGNLFIILIYTMILVIRKNRNSLKK